MPKLINLIGNIYGKLTVISGPHKSYQGSPTWLCICSCDGKEITYRGTDLRGGFATSCGCGRVKHGQRIVDDTAGTYRSWVRMRSRCNDHNVDSYKWYGGRGIKVCERWEKFENFFDDMGYRPVGTSLDRKDPDKDYEPNNCCWSTDLEQGRNKRNTLRATINDITKTLTEWSSDHGLLYATVLARFKNGVTGIDLVKPVMPRIKK